MKFANFVYICITRGKITISEPKVVIFTACNTHICNTKGFTHSKTLFLAVGLDFVLLALIKI